MDNIVDDAVKSAVSTFTPLGCLRNCFTFIVASLVLWVALVVIFVFVQQGL
jgi:hypothetical protein